MKVKTRKMTTAVTNLRIYVLNLGVMWMTIMLGLTESSENGSLAEIPCREGWYFYGEKCYAVMGLENDLNWMQASDKCKIEHGNLATIYSKDLQEFLAAFVLLNVKSDLWIGLHDRNGEGHYEWADGSFLSYKSWDIDEPTGRGDHKEDCVEMLFKNAKLEIGSWNDLNCATEMPFLCQANKENSMSNPDPRLCPMEENGGWKYLNSCYHIVKKEKTWEEAEYYCQEVYGGHLLKILDARTQFYINHILSKHNMIFWIGIQFTEKQKLQKWSSGWQAVFTKWDAKSGNLLEGNCAIVTPRKTWNSAPCDLKFPFVCETSKDPGPPVLKQAPAGWICPTTSDEWKDLGGESCYILEPHKSLNWLKANFYCHKKGGNLASIHSDAESHLLHPHVFNTKERVLIGIHRNLHNNKIFEWADGSDLDYENWAVGEPNGDNEKCGELWTETMKWNDVPCNIKKGFICSARKVPSKSHHENHIHSHTRVSATKHHILHQKASLNKGGISWKAGIGITVLVLVICVFIGFTIRYFVKSHIPDSGFRYKKNTASSEELQPITSK